MGILEGLTPVKDIDPCKVGRTLMELEVDDRAVLILALEDERWTSRALSAALRSRGVTLSRDTIQNHRSNTCRCSRT